MTPPNILVLFSDQHQAAALGCENHPDLLTPSLDRLAASGARFTRAYCQDGVCVPSRCSLFSGLHPRTLGCYGNTGRSTTLRDDVVSLPLVFQRAGYRTASFGKRHMFPACDAGWDAAPSHLPWESRGENYPDWVEKHGHSAALDRDWSAEFGRGMEGTPRHEIPMPIAPFSMRASELPEDMTMEAWTRQKTVEFLRAQKNAARPFFCFSSFYRPHQPYTPLPSYLARFDRSKWGAGRLRNDGIALPPSLRQPATQLPPMLQEWRAGNNRVWCLDDAFRDEQLFRDYIAAYYALVEEIDAHIGGILDCLDETGLRENTVILYTSDHGDFAGRHGMCEKCAHGHNVYEETLRVPLLLSWRGRVPATVSDGLVELLDVYPTLLGLAGIPLPPARHAPQGLSLVDHLCDAAPVGRQFVISGHREQISVITRRHKLGVWQPPAFPGAFDFRAFGDMLFDREADPLELDNLRGSPAVRDVENELRAHLREWMARTPENKPDLPPAPRTA